MGQQLEIAEDQAQAAKDAATAAKWSAVATIAIAVLTAFLVAIGAFPLRAVDAVEGHVFDRTTGETLIIHHLLVINTINIY